jgi:hypothetical protein
MKDRRIHRYCLTVYVNGDEIYYQEFNSINQVAFFLDRFKKFHGLGFELFDDIKQINISVNELMEVWHA